MPILPLGGQDNFLIFFAQFQDELFELLAFFIELEIPVIAIIVAGKEGQFFQTIILDPNQIFSPQVDLCSGHHRIRV